MITSKLELGCGGRELVVVNVHVHNLCSDVTHSEDDAVTAVEKRTVTLVSDKVGFSDVSRVDVACQNLRISVP